MRISPWLLALLAVFDGVQPIRAEGEAPPPSNARQLEFFEKRIRPLLADHCHECHSTMAKAPEAGLRLDSRAAMIAGGDSGPAIVPADPDKSELIMAVRYEPDGYQMPPDGPLNARQIDDLVQWVTWGAPWPRDQVKDVIPAGRKSDVMARARHWAFQPLDRSPPPAVKLTSWPRNAVDHFILSKLEASGLAPAADADDRTWLRRVYFGLIGLPPSPAEMEAFLADRSRLARQRKIDDLLASPHYGERWARHWLDLMRFAETAGNEFDYEIPFAWKYRDYVIQALNTDLPYDQFIVEHIAGDLLTNPRRDLLTGTNTSVQGTGFFWLGQAMQSPIDVLAEQYETIENQLDVMGKSFLGLTVACARCHDHKFDPVSQQDYYALVGFLQSSQRQFAFLDDPVQIAPVLEQLRSLDRIYVTQLVDVIQRQLEGMADQIASRLLATEVPPLLTEAPRLVASERAADDVPTDKSATEGLAGYLAKAAGDSSDPLYDWVRLAAAATDREFEALRERLLAEFRTVESSESDVTFEEFTRGYLDRWRATGRAFEPASESVELFVESRQIPVQRLVPLDVAHSGRTSGRLHGEIRSRTFTIEKPFIDYLMYRTASDPPVAKLDAPDLKRGQVHLIIDGFQLIREPIYQGLSIDVAVGTHFRWYRQDVSKWIGHRAYIEIVDGDNGSVAVDRIVFRDGERPLSRSHPLVGSLLRNVSSREEYARAFEDLVHRSLQAWREGALSDAPDRNQYIELINWLIAVGPRYLADSTAHLPDRLDGYLATRRDLEARIGEPRRGLATSDGTGENASVLIRGNHKRPAEVAHRRFLEVLGGATFSGEGSGRLELAQAIVEPSNPLPARVMVNRIWQHLFGAGIVATVDDFGAMGRPPTHPGLLDYLASEFIRSGWSVKEMQRLIVSSRTFAMSSKIKPGPNQVDPDNRLLHRMPVQRLEGEAIRDAVLAVSGRLNRQMHGEGVLPYLTPFMEGRGRPETSGPRDGDGRRSVYLNVRRNFLNPMFLVFDYPLPLSAVGRRGTSNVPAQALTMLNNPFVIEQARVFAKRLLRQEPGPTESRVRRLYERALGRLPIPDELGAAADFVDQQLASGNEPVDAWADLCHILFNAKDFIYVR